MSSIVQLIRKKVSRMKTKQKAKNVLLSIKKLMLYSSNKKIHQTSNETTEKKENVVI